ncbi:MAG TPA: BON domain-containing protein [Anaerolineales bacterium]|nr:BON domain-containing protein [Anaerolineales bacterium]
MMYSPIVKYSSVSERVIQALQDDPRTREGIMDVVNEQGLITLTGTVSSQEMRQAADEIARRQEGVITVINDLKVG